MAIQDSVRTRPLTQTCIQARRPRSRQVRSARAQRLKVAACSRTSGRHAEFTTYLVHHTETQGSGCDDSNALHAGTPASALTAGYRHFARRTCPARKYARRRASARRDLWGFVFLLACQALRRVWAGVQGPSEPLAVRLEGSLETATPSVQRIWSITRIHRRVAVMTVTPRTQ